MVRLDAPLNATFMIRLQNTVAGSSSVKVAIAKGLGMNAKGCVETTMSLQQSREQNERSQYVWNAEGEGRAFHEESLSGTGIDSDCSRQISLDPLDIRTFTFYV